MLKLKTVAETHAVQRPAVSKTLAYSALPRGARLSMVTTLPGLLSLAAKWQELELSCRVNPSVFQSFSWISSWAKTYILDSGKLELCVITGFQEERLVFVLPLMKDQRGPVTILRWLSEPFCQYGDALIAEGQNPGIWLNQAMKYVQRLKNIDIIRLRHVRADAAIHGFCVSDMIDAKLHEKAPYLDLTAFTGDESYEARYTSTQRKRRKKIRKELETQGEIAFRTLPHGATCDAAIAEAIAEKNKWLEERGRQNRILRCPGHVGFLKLLSHDKNSGVEMVTSELSAGERAVSWEIGFNFHGTHYAYITSHVNALTDLSPGRLHMDLSQRHCIAQGLARFDLMVPHDAHKESWSSACMETNDYYLPITLTGRVFGNLYLRILRPIVREFYYKTPRWVLRIVKPLLGV